MTGITDCCTNFSVFQTVRMYGLLLEAMCEALKSRYGDEKWNVIREKAGIHHNSFITHKTYSEAVIPRLMKAAVEVRVVITYPYT